jgi:hypothetical protein
MWYGRTEMEHYSVKIDWTDAGYILLEDVLVFSERYQKWIIALTGEEFDGASGAIDVCPLAWIPHDVLCRDGEFADGSLCSNLEASFVISDQLWKYGRKVRAVGWFIATWVGGGGEARKNGMW